MIKTLDTEATYEISRRSRSWLKMKKDYVDGVGDTLDLVVMGAYYGVGKRTGVYGGYLLGCYNPTSEEYESVCKIGTGFTDEDLAEQYKILQDKKVDKVPSYYQFDPTLKPDDIFEPSLVFEVKCADITISPRHKAASGLTEDGRGISLRFPRFLRIRDDKNADDATSSEQVLDMYMNQEAVANQKIEGGEEKEEGEEDEEQEDENEHDKTKNEEKEDVKNVSNTSEGSSKENETKSSASPVVKKASPTKKPPTPTKKSPKKEVKASPAKKTASIFTKKSAPKAEDSDDDEDDTKKSSPTKKSPKKEAKKTASIFTKKSAPAAKAEDSDDEEIKKTEPKRKRSRIAIDSDDE